MAKMPPPPPPPRAVSKQARPERQFGVESGKQSGGQNFGQLLCKEQEISSRESIFVMQIYQKGSEGQIPGNI